MLKKKLNKKTVKLRNLALMCSFWFNIKINLKKSATKYEKNGWCVCWENVYDLTQKVAYGTNTFKRLQRT